MSTGIEARHTRKCASRNDRRCDCTPTWQANVWDARAARRIRKTFPTKTAAKQWRTDAIVALRRGELSADRGPTLAAAAEQWLGDVRAGYVTNRSGDPFKPSAIRAYADNLRLRVLPELGHLRLREVTTRDVQRLIDKLVRDDLAPGTIDANADAAAVALPARRRSRRGAD